MISRLEKRCFVTSVSAHAALAVLLLVAPAFRQSPPPAFDSGVPLEMMAGELIDAALAPGFVQPTTAEPPPASDPEPTQPPPRQPEPAPEPQPVPTPAPPTKRPPPDVEFDLPKAREPGFTLPSAQLEPKKTPKEKPKEKPPEREAVKIDLSKLKSLKSTPKPSPAKPSGPTAQELARQRRQDLARSLDGASGRIAGAVSRGAVEIQIGPVGGGGGGGGGTGGGNSAYAWHVRNAFINAWIPPQNVSDELATADVEVVIRKDGRVTQARLVKRSGVSALDRSVQDALGRVREIVPFEAGATETERSYTIGFNLRSKRTF